jgi:hypothetical protein
MENVTYVQVREYDTSTIFAVIDRGNGEFTTMPKSDYDAMLVEQAENADKL